jgi:hypothetical protein
MRENKKKWRVNDCQDVFSTASWEEAFELTKGRWNKEGLGEMKASGVAYSPVKSSSNKEDKVKQMKDCFYHLLDYAQNDDSVRLRFLDFVEQERVDRNDTAVRSFAVVEGEQVVVPVPMGKQVYIWYE